MRHLVKGSKLSRGTSHRKAMLRNLACSLIENHRIQTTVTRAKELRSFIEPLITRAKEDTHHNRKQVFSSLQNKYAVTELFEEIGPICADRPGGYTRVIKAGFRKGDGAEMAVIELVDYNDIKPESRRSKKKRTRRAGKSNKPTSSTESESTTEDNSPETDVEALEDLTEEKSQEE